jgi:hypothetical protein
LVWIAQSVFLNAIVAPDLKPPLLATFQEHLDAVEDGVRKPCPQNLQRNSVDGLELYIVIQLQNFLRRLPSIIYM